jgi:hypothetical protein
MNRIVVTPGWMKALCGLPIDTSNGRARNRQADGSFFDGASVLSMSGSFSEMNG